MQHAVTKKYKRLNILSVSFFVIGFVSPPFIIIPVTNHVFLLADFLRNVFIYRFITGKGECPQSHARAATAVSSASASVSYFLWQASLSKDKIR